MEVGGQLNLADPFLTPATLAMNLWPDGFDQWIPQAHLTYASARIAAAILRGNGRLIVSMPPRHGKSRLISETTIPWYLEKFPGRHVMLVSYNQDMAEEFGGKAKDIIQSRGDLFSYGVRSDRSRVEQFETTTASYVRFSGINGGQTGKGAHLVIIDDFIKDIEEALSPTQRQKVWLKFLANIWSRLEPGATIIIVATRWHSEDLIGRVLSKLKGWEYICFPAFAEEKDVIGRVPGQVLFPERYPEWRLNEIRDAETGTTIFEALYQQRPIDDQSVFTSGEWLQVVHGQVGDGLTCVRAWDMAATQGGGDWTTGTKMGRDGLSRRSFIMNVVRKQFSPLKVEELIRSTAVADGLGCTILLEQEPGSQGAALIEHYKTNVLPEFVVHAVPAGNKSKFTKAQPFIAACESGNVFLVDNVSGAGATAEPRWITEYRLEFAKFGRSDSDHDDQIDTSAMCYNHLFQPNVVSPVWGRGDGIVEPTQAEVLEYGYAGARRLRRSESSLVDAELDSVYGSGGNGSQLITGATW